jgi:FtsP/CotA-like multicopper oxidase with cupredoxin domain
MRLSRRGVIAGMAAGMSAPRFLRAETAADGFTVMVAKPVAAKLMEGDQPPTSLWSYDGSWPPAILHAKQGQEFKVRFVNELDRAITVHWYGVRGPSAMMSIAIEPGAANAFDCVFTPPDAGTFWFGPVADISRQREMGLYGMLIVDEAVPPADLPSASLIFDDWRLGDDGQIDEKSFGDLQDAISQGRLGNWFTVNGTYRPRLEVSAGLARLRILNTANVRSMAIIFKGADPWIIAEDGQPVPPRPIAIGGLALAPGQRSDLLIEEGSEEITIALNLFEDVVEAAYLVRTGKAAMANIPDNFMLPANPIARTPDMSTARTLPFLIEGGEKGGMTGAIYRGEKLDTRALLEQGMAWAFNGTSGLAAEPWQVLKQGETIVLEIENRTRFDQPLHLHGHVWSIIAEEPVWRDTIIANRSAVTRAVFVADNTGDWGIMSAIAERADSGLITSFRVEP